MQSKTMTVTRALAELKVLGDRINNKIAAAAYTGLVQGENQTPVGVAAKTAKEFQEQVTSGIQSIQDLMSYRQALKSAVILSNAQTFVELLGEKMTVAEAIELKGSVAFKENMLAFARAAYTRAISSKEASNAKLEESIQALLNTALGAEKSKATEEQLSAIRTPQEKLKKVEVLNAQQMDALIATLQEEIEAIKTELDFTLSESNAKTVITVTY